MTPCDLMLLDLRNTHMAIDRDVLTKRLTDWRRNFETIQSLKAAGLWNRQDDVWYSKHGVNHEVQAADLPKLRTVFAQVKAQPAYQIEDATKATVRVYLDLGNGAEQDPYFSISVYYVRALDPDGRCQIVTTREVRSEVVCSVGG